MCTSHEADGPGFAPDYTVCRATLARIERLNGMTDGGKKPLPNSPAYLWTVATIPRG